MSDTDYGLAAHRAVKKHLSDLDECFDYEEATNKKADWPESAGPYDGCEDCVIRETLWVAWPFLRQAALEGAE